MKNFTIYTVIALFLFSSFSFAQNRDYDSGASPPIRNDADLKNRIRNEEQSIRNRGASNRIRSNSVYDTGIISRRFPRKRIIREQPLAPNQIAKITPAREDFEKYSEFLDSEKTGLVKILSDPGCNVLKLQINDPKCSNALPIKGSGSYYSFRTFKHSGEDWADIHYINNKIKVGFSDQSLGYISDLGDTSIESLSLKSPQVKFIRSLPRPKTYKVLEITKNLAKTGIVKDNFTYSDQVNVELGNTYILRSIGYRWEDQAFNDKRVEAVVAFKVVNVGSEGEITILWRRLKEKKSPKLID